MNSYRVYFEDGKYVQTFADGMAEAIETAALIKCGIVTLCIKL